MRSWQKYLHSTIFHWIKMVGSNGLRQKARNSMERLTYVTENGEVLFHPADLPDDEGITITQLAKDGRYKALEEIAERLANREQAEAKLAEMEKKDGR